MAAQHEMGPESMAPIEKGAFKRRGLIAGAAALAAGVLATRMGSETVNAGDNSNLMLGAANNANNTEVTLTTLTTPTTGSGATLAPTTAGFRVLQAGVATPDTSFDAIQGFATAANNSGAHGRNDALNGIGTTGVATNGTGVYGQSSSGSGVGGVSTSAAGRVWVVHEWRRDIYGITGSGDTVHVGITTSGTGSTASIDGRPPASAALHHRRACGGTASRPPPARQESPASPTPPLSSGRRGRAQLRRLLHPAMWSSPATSSSARSTGRARAGARARRCSTR